MTGNLKHKDLYGQVVSSQVYANGDEDETTAAEATEPQMEGDLEQHDDSSVEADDKN